MPLTSSSVPVSKPTTEHCNPKDCRCGCCCHDNQFSNNPIKYANGEIDLTVTDLQSGGFGMEWGHARSYVNRLSASADFGNGYNWLMDNIPYATIDADGSTAFIFNSKISYWFDLVDGNYVARYGARQTLVQADGWFYLQFPEGEVIVFYDFSNELMSGRFSYASSPGDRLATMTYDGFGNPSQLERTDGTSSEIYQYTFGSSGADANRIIQITLIRNGVTYVSQVLYRYHDGSDGCGSLGDLRTATQQLWDVVAANWVTTATYYYRYWPDDTAPGFTHGLKYVVNPDSYRRIQAAGLDPLTATDGELAAFADNYFEYDNATDRRVVLEHVDGGTRQYGYTFELTSEPSDGYNDWRHKTTETRPDGSVRIVFTNFIGQVMLTDLSDGAATPKHWIEYFHFSDEYGREDLHALPSAIDMGSYPPYDEGEPSLTVALNSGAGLIQLTTFYDATDPITDGGAGTGDGSVTGYEEYRELQNGAAGDLVKLSRKQYTTNTSAAGVIIYPVARDTVYRDDGSGSDGVTTSYAYTWFSDVNQASQIVTTLPIVSAAQNGPDTAVSRTQNFDANGYLTSTIDERGFTNTYQYDNQTGARVQQTNDDGGLNLVADYSVDDQGRNTLTLGPVHDVDLGGTLTTVRSASWNVYRDDLNQVWSAQGYYNVGENTYTLINPVSISQHDDDGRTIEQITATRGDTVESSGALSADDSFPESTWVRRSSSIYDAHGHMVASRTYYDLTLEAGYNETAYGYDVMDRQNRTRTPSGTINRTVYDVRGLTVSRWVGTDDFGATADNPAGDGAPNNMLPVQVNEYDGGVEGGDGNLTQSTAPVDDDAGNDRANSFVYDWRNRQTEIDGEIDFCQVNTYDNLDRVIQVDRYDTTTGGNLILRSGTAYDDQGRAYQTFRTAVDPGSGGTGYTLTDNTWYDESGNVLKSKPSGSEAWTKMHYDSVGRTDFRYVGYSTETEDWAEAGTIADSMVFEQSQTIYDDASNVIQTNTAQRFHTDGSTEGALIVPPTSSYFARPGYVVMYPDGIGRTVNVANYGTNANSSFTRADMAPTRSDDILVTSTGYNIRGEAVMTVDPAETVSVQFFDDAGRRVRMVENYVESGTDPDQNRTTTWEYNLDGQMIALSAINAATGIQVTQYQYGVSLAASTIASNNLLYSVTYPDGGTVVYEYNRQGQRIALTDQNATIHQFDFDQLGRQTQDRVTQVGLGIDAAVRRIEVSYEVRGLVYQVTCYDDPAVGSGTVLNQVRNSYNAFMQLSAQDQEHDGTVSGGVSRRTLYNYSDGSGNMSRLQSFNYPEPSANLLTHLFNDTFSDKLSRPDHLSFAGTAFAGYSYLGLGSIVQATHAPYPHRLLWNLASGSGANPYAGLDRFGRTIDCHWTAYDDGGGTLDQIQYGYDRVGNRLWRYNVVAHTNSADFDELYSYDGLYQLADLQRGSFSSTPPSGFGSQNFQQTWSLDPTGNWQGFVEKSDGSTVSLDQARDSNRVNEIVGITNSTGGSWTQPVYDGAGNMTRMPQPASPGDGYTAVYDAWNRLVRLMDGEDIVQENIYDGLTRRIVKKSYTAGSLSETRHYYYSKDWQVLEEYLGDTPNTSDPDRRFFWGLRYIDDLIARNSTVSSSLDTGHIPLQDANWNVSALCDPSPAVVERYAYSAYGVPQFLDSTFTLLMTNASAYDWETLYCGYRYDADTGLYHVRFRPLYSLLGTWLTRDSLEEYELTGPSLYRYVTSNPLNRLDPLGLLEKEVVEAIKSQIALLVDQGGEGGKKLKGQVKHAALGKVTEAECVGLMVRTIEKFAKLDALKGVAVDIMTAPAKAVLLAGGLVTNMGKTFALRAAKALAEYLKDTVIDGAECDTVTFSHSASDKLFSQTLNCNVLICAKVTKGEGFFAKTSINDWSFTGACEYTCTPGDWCCPCGKAGNATFAYRGGPFGLLRPISDTKLTVKKENYTWVTVDPDAQ